MPYFSGLIFVIAFAFTLKSFACSTFGVHNASESWVGKNYDWHTGIGSILVNPSGLAKFSFTIKPGDVKHTWTSRYASVTFNQYGRELAISGINQEGLIIETLWLEGTKFPFADKRPSLNELQWVQYQLDTAASTQDVINSLKDIRISNLYAETHYFVCDAKGICATIEFLDSKVKEGKATLTTWPALTNDTYEASLKYLAGFEGFGGTKPIDSKSIDSPDRFVRVAKGYKDWAKKDAAPLDKIFETLKSAEQFPSEDYGTQWSIAYDRKASTVYFKTMKNPDIRSFSIKDLNKEYCKKGQPAIRSLSLVSQDKGDLSHQWDEFNLKENEQMIDNALDTIGEFKNLIPRDFVKTLKEAPFKYTCSPNS